MNNTIMRGAMSCQQITGIEARPIMLTPAVAAEMLKANLHNRKISQLVVERYVNEINNDAWMLTAQGIGFDRDGILNDGQHRLAAIVASRKTVPILFVYGLAPKSQEKVDRQRKRTLYDVFSLAGYANNKSQVQIANFITSLNNSNGKDGRFSTASDSDVKSTLECHRDAINGVLLAMTTGRKGFRVGYLSACVFLYEMDKNKAMNFMNSVKNGVMLTYDSPEMRLRKYLFGEGGYTKVSSSSSKNTQILDYKKTCFAINAFLSGRKITALKESDKIIGGPETI